MTVSNNSRGLTRRSFLEVVGTGAVAGAVSSVLPAPAIASTPTLRIGYISPQTGALAPFAEADPFMLGKVREVLKDGLKINGTNYQVEIAAIDDQSNSDRSATSASQLINGDGVNLMLAQGALTNVPVASQCEAAGVPCITTMDPWQGWMFPLNGKPDEGFSYVNHFFWGIEDIIQTFIGMWDGQQTNKSVGTVWSNDPPGKVFASPDIGFPASLGKGGYKVVDVGDFQPGADDFSRQIVAFRDAGCDIVTGLFAPPEWAVFWRQAQQLGFKPKIATPAKALLFPAGVEALGPNGDGMSTEIWWAPSYPFKSTLTGQSCKELADDYEKTTGKRWTQPIGVIHALWELGINALKNAADPTDPDSVQNVIKNTKLTTVVGDIDWLGSPIKNVAKLKIAGGQWRLQPDGKYDLAVTYNKNAPEVPLQADFTLSLGKKA
ncbi:ABC transporter substrate-binding protein [Rhizobium bangladeshense]|uniref:ABC transporter substrate-binding protein n=1 Tax=Rhizobium bangladeshense TaxID=1138189 RepID=UPI001C82C6EF|nr:ABC transporter substrate-binding protein [Rhizobium bangladeshense]MBX4871026.1 ABC transporter substrate-binding protein [Rhizobium bangladeshense]MBX4871326.1 ABC transporter substrate-binding protein [Rhizobium bangladeshense]MBX4887590.1 ABC transporter substrate-binding protein [Rhizobium bangladeshense]